MKSIITSAFIIATIAAGAQEQKLRKACVKMEREENGVVTKIDTCVTASTEEELRQKLSALGVDDFGQAETTGEGTAFSYTKVIIDEGEGKTTGRAGERRRMKTVARTAGNDGQAEVFIIDDEGNITRTSAGNNEVIVKTFGPDENADEEIKELLKEHGMENEKCEGKKVIIKASDKKEGKEGRQVKVFVLSKSESKKLSAAERKKLPSAANKAIESGNSFDNLLVAPNPTEDACTITYRPVSKDPLQIKVYNEEGKTVMSETEANPGDHVNKTLSLKELGQGVYFVHLTQGKQSEVRKVMVK